MKRVLLVNDLERPGLRAAGFAVDAGECVLVQGPSGAGKTLLLRTLADLDPFRGNVVLDGRARTEIPGPEWRRRVAFVPAVSAWWSERVRDHFHDWQAALTAVERLGLPADVGRWDVSRLSTGERQRLAAARALVLRPRVLLLDEPTSGLDEAATRAVEELVRAHLAEGACALWVTHDSEQAARLTGRVLAVRDGHVEETVRGEAS